MAFLVQVVILVNGFTNNNWFWGGWRANRDNPLPNLQPEALL